MIKFPLNVTIDTNIFDACKYDFSETGTLNHLVSYVQKGKIKIFMSNVVLREMDKHIRKQAEDAVIAINSTRKDLKKAYSLALLKSIGIETDKMSKTVASEQAHKDLEEFLAKMHPEILDNTGICIDDILDDYFQCRLPFENSDRKRKEFPDAIIVAQIKRRFENREPIAIITNDDGFKGALGKKENFLFYVSLGELLNKISQQEENYATAISLFQKRKSEVCTMIQQYISDMDCIDVYGVSYDKDGVAEGYDYSETELTKLSGISSHIHVIEEIRDNMVYAMLNCRASFVVNCLYEDYDNAAWDSETKMFIYVETCEIQESHNAVFPVRIEMNLETEEIKIKDFRVRLGGDSRKSRVVIDNEEYDYILEFNDMERESLGLRSLSGYKSWLEEDLIDSEMKQAFVEKFEEINRIYGNFQEISNTYEEILDELQKNKHKTIDVIKKHSINLEDEEYSADMDDDEIGCWLKAKLDVTSKFASDDIYLPDIIEYGSQIPILDADENTYILKLASLNIHPSEGEEELIDIDLMSEEECVSGYVKLTVGFQEFDDEYNAADGLDDDIEYYYEKIIEKIEEIIESMKKFL